MNIEIENGKYTFVQRESGACEFLRHGEPWMDISKGVKAIISMACELEELRDGCARRDALLRAEAVEDAICECLDEDTDTISGDRIRSLIARHLRDAIREAK